ncbi:DNA internalization-related competence protein ComEC/Rec2 [Bacillus sp. EAC]|uniref:DNA internalization-related competence protein ComEC/Rec2 n=1 Tax=Bacillus sp. EAC TaxID=1978338 RepID=UPI000B44C30D|nr:DNA internalization-related competence protein ComEC/Rec2 [Bacillus sp. EAC]
MSIVLAYITLGQILTIIYFNEDHQLFILLILLILLVFLLIKRKWICFYSYILTVILTSIICFIQNDSTLTPKAKPSKSIHGEISTSPIIDGNKISFSFKLQEQRIMVSSYAHSKNELTEFQERKIGDICKLEGESSKPEPNSNPYIFNYKEYLLNQNIQWLYTAEAKSLNCVEGKRTLIQSLILSRTALTNYVEKSFNDQTEGYINALLFGERTKMDVETESQYQIVGIVHLLAISGSHISLLSLVIYYLFVRVGFTKESSLIITIMCIFSYGYLAGASASVVRAVIIGILVCVYKLMKKKINIISLLFISCIVMLFAKPSFIADIGFQFSFVTSFVLVLTSKRLLQYKTWYGQALFASCTTQLVSIPILLANFHEISPYSIILNLIFIPYITFIIMPLCLICFTFSFFPHAGEGVEHILTLFIKLSDKFLTLCMHLPFVKLTFMHPSLIVVFMYVITIFLIFYFMEKEKEKKLLNLSLISFFALVTCHYFYPYFNPVGKVIFVDVGQGDCTLIKLPFNKGNYLIDTGGRFNINQEKWQIRKNSFSTGKDIVLPILKGEGISKIHKLIFTHGDYDHIGGGEDVLTSFNVEELYVGDKQKYTLEEQKRVEIAIKHGTIIQKVSEGFSWRIGNNHFQILSPVKRYSGEENHGSIVLKAKMNDKSWLFTGDLDISGEMRLISNYPKLKSDILKIGHHGSDTSTSDEFIRALSPKIAIISVGKSNRYGHPKKEVINRLNENHVTILRTDLNGAISYEFKYGQGTFFTFTAYRKT